LGWIDFKNDTSASEAVLLRVEISTKETGMTGVHLPPNFNDLDRGEMLVDGFNELSSLSTIYNYPY
jgi:hypothetical protein